MVDGIGGVKKGVLDAIAEFGRRGLTCPPVLIGGRHRRQ